MDRVLIVNADDLNLTEGVSQAILDCHDRGILTSSTILMNLPLKTSLVRALKKRKKLGLGLHLNVTLDYPVSQASQVRSLLSPEGRFRKVQVQMERPPKAEELLKEWEAQIRRFRKIFSRLPTHLDTHHQTHDHPFFFRVLKQIAKRHRLPVRRSRWMPPPYSQEARKEGVLTTDYFFGDLNPSGYWRHEKLVQCLQALPEGTSEIMCHPGRDDKDLRSISSFTSGREAEWRIFSSSGIKELVLKKGIVLSHFGLCYTKP